MRGSGRTVFQGNQVEEFQVEILGVIENIGPKESLILARLSGGPLEHTGVMQGMSGSPVRKRWNCSRKKRIACCCQSGV